MIPFEFAVVLECRQTEEDHALLLSEAVILAEQLKDGLHLVNEPVELDIGKIEISVERHGD